MQKSSFVETNKLLGSHCPKHVAMDTRVHNHTQIHVVLYVFFAPYMSTRATSEVLVGKYRYWSSSLSSKRTGRSTDS